MTRIITRALFLPTLIVAVGVLIKGYVSTGDGFAAGVIAALAILLQVVVFGVDEVAAWLPLRYAPTLAVAGLGLGLAVAFVPVLFGRPILTHAPGPDESVIHLGTLELLTAVLFDVAVFCLVLGFAVSAITIIARVRPWREP